MIPSQKCRSLARAYAAARLAFNATPTTDDVAFVGAHARMSEAARSFAEIAAREMLGAEYQPARIA